MAEEMDGEFVGGPQERPADTGGQAFPAAWGQNAPLPGMTDTKDDGGCARVFDPFSDIKTPLPEGKWRLPDVFDPTKPCRTRDGRAARVVCSDRQNEDGFPVVALIEEGLGEALHLYRLDGTRPTAYNGHDLVNLPATIEGWVNVYRRKGDGEIILGAMLHPSKETALSYVGGSEAHVGCIAVDFEEGEGL